MVYLKLIRIKHWVKNLFLFIPLFFSGDFLQLEYFPSLLAGFLAFGLVASCVYILNDYRDIEADRKHPVKSKRPLASGAVAKNNALVIFGLFLIMGFGLAYYSSPKYTIILVIYFLLNIGYSFGLKNISILDIFIVAAGFVLRVKGGGVISDTYVSHWMVLMVFLLALFIAIAKRRDDLVIKQALGLDMRKASKKYNIDFLNLSLTMVSGIMIVSYIMYTISPEVVNRIDNHRLYYTSIFVIAGILRYLQIAIVENNTGSPTELLFRDRFIQVVLLLWLINFFFIIYYPNITLLEG